MRPSECSTTKQTGADQTSRHQYPHGGLHQVQGEHAEVEAHQLAVGEDFAEKRPRPAGTSGAAGTTKRW